MSASTHVNLRGLSAVGNHMPVGIVVLVVVVVDVVDVGVVVGGELVGGLVVEVAVVVVVAGGVERRSGPRLKRRY
jgi:hypothetical protein